MDFILRRIENKLQLNEPGEYDYIVCLKARIEYCLFLSLGFLWKNLSEIPQEKRSVILSDLANLTVGSAVSAIRELDYKDKEILINKKCTKIFNDYPAIRNNKMGHGYSISESIASSLVPLYDDLVENIPLLKEDCDLVVVKKYDPVNDTYIGIRFAATENGIGTKWSCPQDAFVNKEIAFPRTYLIYNNMYYKVSPFVYIDPNTQEPLLFRSLSEKITGKTKLCPLFPDMHSENRKYEYRFEELICIKAEDDYRQFSKSNGTIMNHFIPNYSQYVDVGFQNLIGVFLNKNKAYVTATIWGHGGVGKTASIQKMCIELFNDTNKRFSYIVFVTAKDRVYNTKTGKINAYSGNIRLYEEVIEIIAKTIFDCKESLTSNPQKVKEYETKIKDFEDTMLIVIDDYETFENCEKTKIVAFLGALNARYHKAIITTRNKQFVIGEAIPSSELDVGLTKRFIEEVVKSRYKEHYYNMQKLLSNEQILEKIHIATSGRPIFIYQFIHIYVQRGYQDEFIENIRTSKDAQEFLYGRIVQCLSANAQKIFASISMLVDEDLRFNFEVLEYILSKAINDKEQFESNLKEIVDQKIVERINDVYGRVYSPELLRIMKEQYSLLPMEFQDTVRNLLSNIGGKDIKRSILDAMLEQADKSRAFGNENETVEKYRAVLNNKKGDSFIRKTALKHVADYLSNSRLNTQAAIKIIEDYLPVFSNDVDIYMFYVYLLWSQEYDEKEKAVKVIEDFFSNPQHKKTGQKYLIFFALGTGYRIDYDINYRLYPKKEFRKVQYSKTFNEYGKELFDYIDQQKILKGKAALFHNIRVALIQTLKLCCYLCEYEKNNSKAKYGLKICKWMRATELKEPFITQINRLESRLEKMIENRGESIETLTRELPQIHSQFIDNEIEEETFWSGERQYCVGDELEVEIKCIMKCGVLVKLDKFTTGLIHISEIADRYISNINDEFKVGEKNKAKIIAIDEKNKRISLSTMGYR